MPSNENDKMYIRFRNSVQRDFFHLAHKQSGQAQYSSIANPNHSHNNVDSPAIPFQFLQGVQKYVVTQTTSLSSIQIKALHTTPIVLVKAPTARSVVIVHSVTARLVYSGTAYTGANNLEFRYTDGSGTKVTADIPNTFINNAGNAFYHAPEVTAAFAPIEGGTGSNGQIVVCVPTANPATGTSTMFLTIHYHLVSFTA